MEKLLVIRLGALGDLIHVSPSLSALKESFPELEIHFLTSPLYKPLVETFPGINQGWTYNKKTGWSGFWQLFKQLKAQQFDAIVNLHPSIKTRLLTFLLHPAQKALYQKEKIALKGIGQRSLPRKHAIEDFYQPFKQKWALPDFTEQSRIPKLNLEASRIPHGIGIIPGVGSKRANRAWPIESYQALIHQLLQLTSEPIYIIGGADEIALGTQLAQNPRVENHCGKHTILETVFLLAGCRLIISGDTGPLHLASTVNVPLIPIFGPTSLDRTGPVSDHLVLPVTPPETLTCWPCELAQCPLSTQNHLACMREISVDQVVETCQKVLSVEAEKVLT